MSEARAEILDAVRRALGRAPGDGSFGAGADAGRDAPVCRIRPAFVDDPIERLIRKLASRSGTVARVTERAAVPAAVDIFASAHGLPRCAAVGAGLRDLIWPPDWTIHEDRARIDDRLSVSPAFAGIAETGTLMLLGSPESPTSHNFVPENQVVVLAAGQVLRHFEDAWARLREQVPDMPRAVNLVSGPSRTADIEQTIQLGAHGPRRLHLVLVDGV